jgi:hypothetical protein
MPYTRKYSSRRRTYKKKTYRTMYSRPLGQVGIRSAQWAALSRADKIALITKDADSRIERIDLLLQRIYGDHTQQKQYERLLDTKILLNRAKTDAETMELLLKTSPRGRLGFMLTAPSAAAALLTTVPVPQANA